jgi:hypothetical protein
MSSRSERPPRDYQLFAELLVRAADDCTAGRSGSGRSRRASLVGLDSLQLLRLRGYEPLEDESGMLHTQLSVRQAGQRASPSWCVGSTCAWSLA